MLKVYTAVWWKYTLRLFSYKKYTKSINVLVLSIQSDKVVVMIFENIMLVVNNAFVFIVSYLIVNDLR